MTLVGFPGKMGLIFAQITFVKWLLPARNNPKFVTAHTP